MELSICPGRTGFFFWQQKKQNCQLKIYSFVIVVLMVFMRAAPFCIEFLCFGLKSAAGTT